MFGSTTMSKASAPTVRAAYAASNLTAAQIILAEPQQYGGIMLEWAERTLERVKQTVKRAEAE